MAPSLRLSLLAQLHSLLDIAFLTGVALQAMLIGDWLYRSGHATWSISWMVFALLGIFSCVVTVSVMIQIGLSLRRVEIVIEDDMVNGKLYAVRQAAARMRPRARFA